MIAVLVVDDEVTARRGLRRLLKQRVDVEVVGECENGIEAVDSIQRLRPDLVLLDVQMPGMNGVDVVREIGPANMPIVIFVSAFDQFALSAFDLAAIDYVLKPFTDVRFMQAIDRALARHADRAATHALARLVEAFSRTVPKDAAYSTGAVAGPQRAAPRSRFLISIGARDVVVTASDIVWIRADGYYASLITKDHKEYLLRTPLDQLERELDRSTFLRIHRSAIVNLGEARGVERTEQRGTMLVLRDGTKIPVSRTRRDAVLRALGSSS